MSTADTIRADVDRIDALAEYNRETVRPLLAMLDRVAELHARRVGEYSYAGGVADGEHCGECAQQPGDGGVWPCATARALGLDLG